MYKILVDLSLTRTQLRYSGIPQDSRLLFNLFSHMDNISAFPFAFSLMEDTLSLPDKEQGDLLSQSQLLSNLLYSNNRKSLLKRLIPRFYDLLSLFKNKYKLASLSIDKFPGFFWSEFLKHTLDFDDFELSMIKKLYIYSANTRIMHIRQRLNFPQITLDGREFDFVLFQDLRPVKVLSSRKLIRFHDAIPIFFPQFVQQSSTLAQKYAIQNLRKNLDAWIICNSKTSASQILSLAPKMEGKVGVAHCVLPEKNKPTGDLKEVNTIIKRRRTIDPKKIIYSKESRQISHYMISVSTIEPRKNYLTIISAWEKFNLTSAQKVPLIIIGANGWMNESEIKAMQPHIRSGLLIHLENVPIEELRTLYSNADLFITASMTEGFGLPPLEAMQCGCPVIASDISAHREILEKAALYFNPYNYEQLCKLMNDFYSAPNFNLQRQSLINKGYEQVKKYSPDALKPIWKDLFDRISSGKTLEF